MSREIHSGRHSPDAKRLRLIPPRRQRLLLLRREPNVETSAVQPGSSAGATSLPSEAVQERGMDASLELPLCFADIGSPVAPEC